MTAITRYRTLQYQIIQYLLVGALNTAFGYGVYALLVFLGTPKAIALAISTVVGVLFNFKTYGTLVFRNKDNSCLLHFIGVYIGLYILNTLLLYFLVDAVGIDPYSGQFVCLCVVIPINYFALKLFVFKENRK